MGALNLSDSSRIIETDLLCTVFSPRISVMCVGKTKRRLSNLFSNKSNAITELPSETSKVRMVSSVASLRYDRRWCRFSVMVRSGWLSMIVVNIALANFGSPMSWMTLLKARSSRSDTDSKC